MTTLLVLFDVGVPALGYATYRITRRAHARRVLRDQREADSYRSFEGYGEPTTQQPRSTWNDGDQP